MTLSINQNAKTKLNPIIIFGIFILLMLILTPILMYTSNIGHSGGEQKPLTTLAAMLTTIVICSPIICIGSALLFRQWFKQNWWFSIFIILTIVPALVFIKEEYFENKYSYEQKSEEINGYILNSKIEYYNLKQKKIRSISFWKNNKRIVFG